MKCMKMKNNLNGARCNICYVLFIISLFLVSFIFFNISLSAILFIFKVCIKKWNAPIALLISIILCCIIIKKDNRFNLKSFIPYICILVPILIILFSVNLSSQIYDYTYDGNSYHKATIGAMINGWNPVYQNIDSVSYRIPNSSSGSLWSNHYAKASHIFAANIGAFTGNIESGKSINIISFFVLFCSILSFCLKKGGGLFFSLLLVLGISSCPTILNQIFTNYIDCLVYIYMFLTVFCFINFEYSLKEEMPNSLLFYFFVTTISINIKFSLFAYVGIYSLGYYLWYLFRLKSGNIEKNFLKKFTLCAVISVMYAVLVIGLSVYPKNMKERGNPFYPLMGEGKVDIMTNNQPLYFENKIPLEKFIISTFSKMANIYRATGLEAEYKIPFTVYSSEKNFLYGNDIRISGNGLFFSGIFIISIVLLIHVLILFYKKDKKIFIMSIIPITITVLLILFLGEAWWARYFPQVYFIVYCSIILGYFAFKNKYWKAIMCIFLLLIIFNNSLSFYYNINYMMDFNNAVTSSISEVINEEKKCSIQIYGNGFDGALFNIDEELYDINIEYVDEYSNDMKKLYHDYVYWRCKE